MATETPKLTIGQVETLAFPGLRIDRCHARIDTGANTSAIWADSVKVTSSGLEVVFFGPSNSHYTGEAIHFTQYSETVVSSSNGNCEKRYKVHLLVVLAGRRILARFTLADRSTQGRVILSQEVIYI